MKSKFWITLAVILMLIILPAISYYFLKQGDRLRTQRAVPDFTLTDASGNTFSSSMLEGDVYVGSFTYSRCDLCHHVHDGMQRVQEQFGSHPDFHMITLTIDPDHDTLPVLREYAQRLSAGPSWYFLSGERDQTYDLINGGFFGKAKYGEGTPETLRFDPMIVLIGRDGYIKGYYEADDEDEMEQLMEAIQQYLDESPGSGN